MHFSSLPRPSAAGPQHWRPVCVWDRCVLSCPEALPPCPARQASWSQCQLHLYLPSHTYPSAFQKGSGGRGAAASGKVCGPVRPQVEPAGQSMTLTFELQL